MLSLASSIITIVINAAYIIDVTRQHLGFAALFVAMPYLLANIASVAMLTLSLFSNPIKSDRRWSMFFVSVLSSNVFAVLHFSGIQLVNSNLNMPVSLFGQFASLALVPFYGLAVYALGAQLTVMPEARKLITRGPYSVSRHPLYVTYVAWHLLLVPVAQTLVVAALSATTIALLVVRARGEEALLASAFPEYAEYRQRVGWLGRKSIATSRE